MMSRSTSKRGNGLGSCQGRTRIIIDDIDIYNRNLIRKEDDLREETFSELEVAAKECVMAVFTADTKLSKSCKWAHGETPSYSE